MVPDDARPAVAVLGVVCVVALAWGAATLAHVMAWQGSPNVVDDEVAGFKTDFASGVDLQKDTESCENLIARLLRGEEVPQYCIDNSSLNVSNMSRSELRRELRSRRTVAERVFAYLPHAVVALAALAGGAVLVRRFRRRDGGTGVDEAAVSRAAGEAADRIESAPDAAAYENEVYRAWREMTRLLDVPRPAASTPGEFCRAALEAGLDPEASRTLTRAFEDVRYGTADPTTDRERRVVEALRRIEATHGDGGGSDR